MVETLEACFVRNWKFIAISITTLKALDTNKLIYNPRICAFTNAIICPNSGLFSTKLNWNYDAYILVKCATLHALHSSSH